MLPLSCAFVWQRAEVERHPGVNTPFPHLDFCVQDPWLIEAIRLKVPRQRGGAEQGLWKQPYQKQLVSLCKRAWKGDKVLQPLKQKYQSWLRDAEETKR